MRSDAERIGDILDAIAKIQQRTPDNIAAFLADEMVQVWAIHHLQLIGEAARSVSEALRDRHPEIEWPQIVALRNLLVHEYFGINLEQVWNMVKKDVPELEGKIRKIHEHADPR